MSFNDIFKSSYLENITAVSIPDMAIALILSFCLGLFIYFVHRKTYAGGMFSQSFGGSLIAMTMITTMVILAVTSNVVLSLGMVGALSIVRFRTAQRKQVVIRLCTVNCLFTQPSQVDVRTVENENLFRFAHSKCSSFISVSARFGGMEHPCQMLSASTACAMSIYSPVQARVPTRFAAAVSTVSAGLKIMSATPSAR